MNRQPAVQTMDLSSLLNKVFAHAPGVGLRGIIQFVFSADQRLWVEAGDDVRVLRGRHNAADTEIEISAQDFVAVVEGRANVEQLFAAGTIRILESVVA